MSDHTVEARRPEARSGTFVNFSANIPYIVMPLLTLFGVAYTSVARHSMLLHWVLLTTIFALIGRQRSLCWSVRRMRHS